MKTSQTKSVAPTVQALDQAARHELNRLAPQLALLLTSKLPHLTKKYIEQLEAGLDATIVIENKSQRGRKKRVEIPHWEMRKFCLEHVRGLLLQTFDRGGAAAVKEQALSGSLDVNNSSNSLERFRSMSGPELQAEMLRLDRIKSMGPAIIELKRQPVIVEGRRREPVFA